jgi:hypothetical protein
MPRKTCTTRITAGRLKKSLNTALDLGMFHDRVLLNATWYRDREGNQLGGYPLPGQTGFSRCWRTCPPTCRNQGWEFSATSNQIKTKAFSWSTTFNITFNRNKLLSFPNLAGFSLCLSICLGKPTSEVFGYRFTRHQSPDRAVPVPDQQGSGDQ